MVDDLLSGYSDKFLQRLHFTGFVDDADLPAIYRGAEWFVFPSKYEGFGIPPLEAMACGTPVISSDAASLPEVLGDAAVYFRSEDKESLLRVLKESVSISADNRSAIIEKGLKQAKKFSWDETAKKLEAIISNDLMAP